jgi:probable rRNA maturation factor
LTSASEQDDVAVGADGLLVEIAVPAAAAALDANLRQTIASSILQANELAGPVCGLVTVLVDDDARVRELNRLWRNIDRPTNVLSFRYPGRQPGPERCVGDIAISYETAAREAAAERKPLSHHMAHLSVHAFLHLLGYDHQTDDAADHMERLEAAILARIDVPDPYIARDADG